MNNLINSMKKKNKRMIRGITFLFKWLFYEKPRGLDFSLRQKQKGIHYKGNHGYALTQEKAFDDIMGRLDLSDSDDFIDIGCGKGGCLYYAAKYKFHRIAGIEIEKELYRIAKKNFEILKLSNRIEIFHANALTFDHYRDFNVYYLFNPFDTDIYIKVLEAIIKSMDFNSHKRIYLCCYGVSAKEYIERTGLFILKDQYTDKVRETDVCIWYRKL